MPDIVPVHWQPDRAPALQDWPMPTLPQALGRGFLCKCPACGRASLFNGWLSVVAACPLCTAPLGSLRADDAPPYFTIFVVGHFVITLAVLLNMTTQMSVALQLAILLPLTTLMSAALLRPIKGATVGLMLRLGMVTEPDGIA